MPPIRRDIFRRCRLERLRKSDVLFEQGDEGTAARVVRAHNVPVADSTSPWLAPCLRCAGKAFYIILAGMVNVNVRVEDCTKLDDINMVGGTGAHAHAR